MSDNDFTSPTLKSQQPTYNHIRMDSITLGDGWLPENGKVYFYFTLIRKQWELIYTARHNGVNTFHDGWDSGIGVNPDPDEIVLFRVLDCPYAAYEPDVNIIGDVHLYLWLGGWTTIHPRRWPQPIRNAIDTLNARANADEVTP